METRHFTKSGGEGNFFTRSLLLLEVELMETWSVRFASKSRPSLFSIASIIGSGINGNLPSRMSANKKVGASLLLLEVELMETLNSNSIC